jgi:hypothetical protein
MKIYKKKIFIKINLMEEECIVCFESFDENISSEKKIVFNHCTPVLLHTRCFIDWINENATSCIVCRENIVDGPLFDRIYTIMTLYDLIRDQHDIEHGEIQIINLHNPEQHTCKRLLAIIIIIIIIIFIITLI